MQMNSAIVSVALLVGVTASSEAQVRRDTIRVAATNAPVWGPDVRLTAVRTIGGPGAPPEQVLGLVTEFVVDRRGRLYVFDEKDHQIKAYDPAGKFVAKIGQRGSAPGEYRGVVGMAIVADSLLAIHDPSNARLTLFEPSGKVHRTISEPRATWWGGDSFFGDNAGRVYVRVPYWRAGASKTDEGAIAGQRYLGFDTKGTLVDSIEVPKPKLASEQPRGFYLMLPEGGQYNFLPQPVTAPAPSGAMVGGSGESMRFFIAPRSGPPRVVERPWTPITLSEGEHANWLEWASYMATQGQGRFTYSIPRTKPAYKDLKVDADGRIWVSVFTSAEKRDLPPRPAGDKRPLLVWRQQATYDVYDPDGTYLGRVSLPHAQEMLKAAGNSLWAMGKGPANEPFITEYRIGAR